jgi:hypothetical protein
MGGGLRGGPNSVGRYYHVHRVALGGGDLNLSHGSLMLSFVLLSFFFQSEFEAKRTCVLGGIWYGTVNSPHNFRGCGPTLHSRCSYLQVLVAAQIERNVTENVSLFELFDVCDMYFETGQEIPSILWGLPNIPLWWSEFVNRPKC